MTKLKFWNRNAIFILLIGFVFNLGLMVLIQIANDFLNNNEFIEQIIEYWAWIYIGAILFIFYIIFIKIHKVFSINWFRLVIIKIAFSLIILLYAGILHLNKFWDFQKNTYRFTLIDDQYYYDDQDASDNPIWGQNQSGYSTTFKYFIEAKTQLEGLKTSVGIISKEDDNKYYIESNGEYIALRISGSIFWQYALIRGYFPINKNQYTLKGTLNRIFQIGPIYTIEILITYIGQSILFGIISFFVMLKWPQFLIKEK